MDDENRLQGRDIFYHGRHRETFFDSIHCITAWRLILLNVPWASWGNPCAASQPKLMPQPFIGDITAWTTFWDSYELAIHENNGLSDIHKFNYLRSLLECTAYEAIAGLTLTAANYHEAITILKKQFGISLYIHGHPVQRGACDLLTKSHGSIPPVWHCGIPLKSLGVYPESYGSLLSIEQVTTGAVTRCFKQVFHVAMREGIKVNWRRLCFDEGDRTGSWSQGADHDHATPATLGGGEDVVDLQPFSHIMIWIIHE